MRTSSFAIVALATIAAAVAIEPTPATSAVYYPWCARYSGGRDSPGVPVCAFKTQAQCMASVRGRGGYCEQNWPQPFAAPAPGRQRR